MSQKFYPKDSEEVRRVYTNGYPEDIEAPVNLDYGCPQCHKGVLEWKRTGERDAGGDVKILACPDCLWEQGEPVVRMCQFCDSEYASLVAGAIAWECGSEIDNEMLWRSAECERREAALWAAHAPIRLWDPRPITPELVQALCKHFPCATYRHTEMHYGVLSFDKLQLEIAATPETHVDARNSVRGFFCGQAIRPTTAGEIMSLFLASDVLNNMDTRG